MVEEITLYNINTGKSLLMNMEDADYLLYEGGIDWGKVEVTHNIFSNSDLLGSYITNTVLTKRDLITISGWIVGKNKEEIYKKKEELSMFINPMQTIRIKHKKYGISGRPQSNVAFSNNVQENNDKMCKFLIQIFCPFPFFDYNEELSVKLLDIVPKWNFSWIIPEEGYVLSTIKNTRFQSVYNNGVQPIGLRIRLEANGIVNNPTIISVTNNEKMRINKTLHADEIVEINTQSKRYVKGIKEGVEESYLDFFDFDNMWLQLAQGTNTLTVKTFDEDGNEDDTYKNLNVILYYNPCFFNLKEE